MKTLTKKAPLKLRVSKEQLRKLNESQLEGVAGAYPTGVCAFTKPGIC